MNEEESVLFGLSFGVTLVFIVLIWKIFQMPEPLPDKLIFAGLCIVFDSMVIILAIKGIKK